LALGRTGGGGVAFRTGFPGALVETTFFGARPGTGKVFGAAVGGVFVSTVGSVVVLNRVPFNPSGVAGLGSRLDYIYILY
jgi:hypothetical protein